MDAYIDPTTGDYQRAINAGGELTRDPAAGLVNAAYLRLMTPLGSWWGNAQLGSRLHELERAKDLARVATVAKQYAEQALQPLLDDGRAASISVEVERQPGRLALSIRLVDAAGDAHQFTTHVKVG